MARSNTAAGIESLIGRILVSGLFFGGAVQKLLSPQDAARLLEGFGLPAVLVWPAAAFNLAAALCLVLGIRLVIVARLLAAYCILTSAFHFIPSDGWQMSIFVKNWAIAGGLLILAAHELREEDQ